MDNNELKLVYDYFKDHDELVEMKQKQKALLKLVWAAELKDAKDQKKYGGSYGGLDKSDVRTSEIREIFGFGPCPGAVEIYNELNGEGDADDED